MFTNDDMDDNERKTFSRQFRKNKVSVFDEGTAAKLSAHLDLPEGDFLLKKYLTNIIKSNKPVKGEVKQFFSMEGIHQFCHPTY